jgi:peptide/nickel transport system permease protein
MSLLRERDFMLATQVLGLSARRRLFGHLLPNTIPILVVMATMAVANAILSESALSYLGLGVVPPTPSWGNMMDAANSLIDFQRRPGCGCRRVSPFLSPSSPLTCWAMACAMPWIPK